MASKLKIDLSQGVLEVEGSESFVRTIYNDFKSHFIEEEPVETEPVKPVKTRRPKTTSKASAKKAGSRTKAASNTPVPEPADQVEETMSEPVITEMAEADFVIEEKLLTETKPSPMKPSYTYLKDLSLGAANGRPSLVEFMDAKFPITNEERNLVFLHYLKNVLGLKLVTSDHIYTCYKAANIRTPLNIEHSLEQTAAQRHWIKIDPSGRLTVTSAGKSYVENQLPKKTKTG